MPPAASFGGHDRFQILLEFGNQKEACGLRGRLEKFGSQTSDLYLSAFAAKMSACKTAWGVGKTEPESARSLYFGLACIQMVTYCGDWSQCDRSAQYVYTHQ